MLVLSEEGHHNAVRTMNTHWIIAVSVVVAVASTAAGEGAMMDQSRRSGQRQPLQVSVEVQSTRWRLDGTGFVRVTVANRGDEVIDEDLTPALVLRALVREDGRHSSSQYWSPLDLATMKNLAVGRATRLTVPARQERAFLVRDAASLLWERMESSLWPSRSMKRTVPPGDYALLVELAFGDEAPGNVASQPVHVSVIR